MYFECEDGTVAEDGSRHPVRPCPLTEDPNLSETERRDEASKQWDELIEAFGQRSLSKATDKLPAMSGLAKVFEKRLGGPKSIASLWSSDLIRGLAWHCLDSQKPFAQYTGPSWSWAGFRGVPRNRSREEEWTDSAEVRGWSV